MDETNFVKSMKVNRYDLSDYLIHFTRNTEKSSFDNLKAIIATGKIYSGWALRHGKRTIYGSSEAVCFTDMPLFSFYQYVKNRHNETKVYFYGIALDKEKMFQLGARNVIYGTTNTLEDPRNPLPDESLHTPYLPEKEQYRYILTKINNKNDWTHEREWRWTNQLCESHDNNLPIWRKNALNDDSSIFDQQKPIIILTALEKEVSDIIAIFKRFTDQRIYNVHNINKTFIVSRESIERNDCMSYDAMNFVSFYQSGILKSVVEGQ
jgi:hypothetical protein